MEESGEGGWGEDGWVGDVVGEVGADFGDVGGGGEGEGVEDGGDEGGCAAEGLGYDGVIFDEDVVGVVAYDQGAVRGRWGGGLLVVVELGVFSHHGWRWKEERDCWYLGLSL